jgi:outer membrane protein assembly factor BamB
VLVLADHDGPSYLLCLDRASGETVWKADRPSSVAWSTPSIVRHAEEELALVASQHGLDAYDVADGERVWTIERIEGAMVASPTPTPWGAVIGSGNKGQTMAIRFGESLRSPPEILWRTDEAASYFSSPLLHRGRLYMVNKVGVAFCLEAESGAEIWHQRLRGPCWASAFGCGDTVYFFGVDGAVEVFRAGDAPEKLAENELREESRLYGYAVASDRMILRYGRRLVCVGKSA